LEVSIYHEWYSNVYWNHETLPTCFWKIFFSPFHCLGGVVGAVGENEMLR
jgi:hypothetical protein